LKYLLSSSRNVGKLDSLGDDGFHRIFESLYRLVRTDKPSFLKAAQSKSKASSTGRLEDAATALRLTVEAGVSNLRFKTASSVIDHIIGTLPMPNDDFCEPLRTDYLKSFRILLEHPPYGEQLKPKQWHAFVDFAIAGISISIGDDEQDSISLSGRDTSMTSRNESHLSIRASQSSAQRNSRRGVKSSLDDLLGALRALSAITNAPVMTRAPLILNSVLECLSSSQRAQDVALEIFNNLALVLKTENIELLRRSISRLVPLLYKLWSTKSAALRDQILVTLSICRTLFLARRSDIGYLDSGLREKILDTLENDYLERSAREMLHFDDVTVQLSTFDQSRVGYSLGPQLGSPRAESNWSLLSSVASLVCGLTPVFTHTNVTADQNEHSNKRRKVATLTHETMKRAVKAEGVNKLAAVQVLFFLFDQPVPVPEDVQATMFELESLLLSDDPQIVVWTMLLFSR
jgi:serine-protein kinase ATM